MNKALIFCVLFLSFMIYTVVVYTYGTSVSSTIASNDAIAGKKLFQSSNCIACHQLYGLGGYLGADLTTVISEKGKGDEYAKTFIKHGTGVMPDFHFTDEEIYCLIEYLKYVDATAITYKKLKTTDDE